MTTRRMSNPQIVDDEYELSNDDIVIYPYPHGTAYPFDNYDFDHLVDFSKKSVEKYNRDNDAKFNFVELKQGLLYRTCSRDSVTAYFKASEPDAKILTFRACINCACDGSLEDSSPRWVSPLSDSEAHDLEMSLELLQEKIMISLLDGMGGEDDGVEDDDDELDYKWVMFDPLSN